jgi:pimeloyl-ACP methyl ester carboxylesterase
MAHRMAQAPNTYPTWFAPKPRVLLDFHPNFLTNFPAHTVDVGPPLARLRYRVVEPADYHLSVTPTNWIERGRTRFTFDVRASLPGQSNAWTARPRGTVVLLHGYALSQFAMAPWAVRLAEEGWRCVLVDLRGHGKSTGRRIFYGTREARDLSQLLDQLDRDGRLAGPVAAMGESYGAALALRWKTVEPRVKSVVAVAPYAGLSNAVLNLSHEYASWMPDAFLKAGLRKLPRVLNILPEELDTTSLLIKNPVAALFVAAADDKITTVAEVTRLYKLAAPGSRLIVVPNASHEAVTYFFDELGSPISTWLLESTETTGGK